MSTMLHRLLDLVEEPERLEVFRAAIRGRERNTTNIREAMEIAEASVNFSNDIEIFAPLNEPIHCMGILALLMQEGEDDA